MNRPLLAASLLTLATILPAQTPSSAAGTVAPKDAAATYDLWPSGQVPGARGTAFDDTPKLWSFPANGPGPHTAVIVLPGGGYNHLVVQQEGVLEAHWLNQHGISAFVLQYRLAPRYLYPWAMVDGARAIRFVRAHAKEWNLKPDAIGVWGFSAGGHLAGYLATAAPHDDARLHRHPEDTREMAIHREDAPLGLDSGIDQLSAHPDFAIINYGRLSLDPSIPGTFGMEALTGKNAPQALVDALSPILHVSKDTSPCFLYATEFDEKVSSLNASRFFEALQRAHVPAELHIFEAGPHGTHMGTDKPQFPELAVYPELLEHWLQLHGWL